MSFIQAIGRVIFDKYISGLDQSNHMKTYYYLKKGETIRKGDEVEMSANYNDPAKWVAGNPKNIGSPAPDPQFMSHRKYRREIAGPNDPTFSQRVENGEYANT